MSALGWTSDEPIPVTIVDAKGDLIIATAADTPTRLPVGTNGQVLTANSATPSGIQWQTPTVDAVQSVNGETGVVVLDAGDVGAIPASALLNTLNGITGGGVLGSGLDIEPDYGTTAGTVAEGNDARIVGAQQRATLTTKGDIYAATAAATTTRLGVGSDGQVLTANSANPTGLGWTTPAADAVQSVNGETGVVVLDAADVGAPPTSRQILTTNGLTGGGDLSADRTIEPVYGTTANTVAEGDDTRIVNAVQNTRAVNTTNGLTGGGDLSADRTIQPTYGTGANTVAQGNDTRIVNAVQQTILDAKGDLIAASAADTPVRLPVGTNGFVLVANSATASGLEWVAVSALVSPSTITRRTTTGDITVADAYLRGVVLNAGPDATAVVVRAGGAGGTIILDVQLTANPTQPIEIDNALCTGGIHVTLSGTVSGDKPNVSVIWAAV